MIKRIFDITLSVIGLIIVSPILLIIAILIKIDSKGPVFYRQVRVGRHNQDFKIFKFRTMHINADKMGLLTLGDRDPRVTKVGYILRKYKLDELPQLLNIVTNDMSFVGPRPEVRKYVNYYTEEDLKILDVKPGITDYASIAYRDEAEILKRYENSEEAYINFILPNKIKLNRKYIEEASLLTDFKIICKTILIIFN